MNFNDHSRLKDCHAFLGASKYHWINYDEEKLATVYKNELAKNMGTRLHAFAAEAISLGIKLPKTKKTINLYVNDAIGFKMQPEQILYYSDNAFGTADTISFKNNFLRIHDLKTGANPASIKQLYIYEALFCLEYGIHPDSIKSELRIYQNDEVLVDIPDPNEIKFIMDKIILFDKQIETIKAGE